MIKDNNLSLEKYQYMVRNTETHKTLKTNQEHIQQSYVRYSLVDFLLGKTPEEFYWNYWMVITFGFNPQKDHVEDTLRAGHFQFDYWLLTNNKLNSMSVDVRSKWVCCPERGNDQHLHYNCFLQLPIKPKPKSYQNEWDAVRVTLRNIFTTLEEGLPDGAKIYFEIHERKRKVDVLKQAQYSTKEMKSSWMQNNHGEDHFANTILSWKDWKVIPLTKRAPKKTQFVSMPKDGALDKFMS